VTCIVGALVPSAVCETAPVTEGLALSALSAPFVAIFKAIQVLCVYRFYISLFEGGRDETYTASTMKRSSSGLATTF
jgi:hypothetical protein